MDKKTILLFIFIALALGILGAFVLIEIQNQEPPIGPEIIDHNSAGPLNATYTIEGREVTLQNGSASQEIATSSATRVITQVVGGPVFGNLNRNGNEDAALILSQNSGGSGTFYYLVAAIKTENGYMGTNGLLMGDRVDPGVPFINNEVAGVSYLDRKSEDSFADEPSVQKHAYGRYNGTVLEDAKVYMSSPSIQGSIASPFTIEGMARGTWLFEGSFHVVLVDWDGLIIAEGNATAKDEWMTEDYVPFEVVLSFTAPENKGNFSSRGSLIFQKSNPSGLPQNDDAVEIPVQLVI